MLSCAEAGSTQSQAEAERIQRRAEREAIRARVTAAKEVVRGSIAARDHFEFTAGHAPSAIERVHAGAIAEEWGRQVEIDRALVATLEAELQAL